LPTMRQKKKKSIFKLFHPQNKTTENLNLRIKEATLKILKKNVNLHFHFDDEEHIWCPIKTICFVYVYFIGDNIEKRRVGLSITNSSLIFDKHPSTWSHSTLPEPIKRLYPLKNEEDDAEVRKLENH
jgi:hypothetical protein